MTLSHCGSLLLWDLVAEDARDKGVAEEDILKPSTSFWIVFLWEFLLEEFWSVFGSLVPLTFCAFLFPSVYTAIYPLKQPLRMVTDL